MRQQMLHQPLWLGLLIVCGLLAVSLTAFATRYGAGVGGDATIYLTSARNLADGRGLGYPEADGSFRILPYTPPFYPLVLTLTALVGIDLLAAARWINALLFGAMVLWLGMAFWRYTARPLWAVLLGGALALSPVLLGVNVWAMSEPLFLLSGFGGLLLLLDYFESRRRRDFFLSALLIGLAFLTRYMGAAFAATAGLALLLHWGMQKQLRRHWTELIQYGFVMALPMLAWVVVDLALTGTLSSRSGQPAAAYWTRFLAMGPALEQIVLFWLMPDSLIARLPRMARAAAWLLAFSAFAVAFALTLRRAVVPVARLMRLMLLFSVVYLMVLTVVQVFTYPPVTLAARMLSPVHVAVLVMLFGVGVAALDGFVQVRRIAWGLVCVALVLVGSYGARSVQIGRSYASSGIGYSAPAWQESQLAAAARALPADLPLISNDTAAVMFLVDRPAYALQEIYQDAPGAIFTAYGDGDDAGQRAFRAGGALVLWNASLAEDFAFYDDQTEERLAALTRGLTAFYETDEGAIYFFQKSNMP